MSEAPVRIGRCAWSALAGVDRNDPGTGAGADPEAGADPATGRICDGCGTSGAGGRRPVEGRVASVHSAGLLLSLDGGAVVALVTRDTPLHPWAVAVDVRLDATGARLDAVRAGHAVRAADGVLAVGPLACDLDGADVVPLSIGSRPPARGHARTADLLRDEIGRRGLSAGFPPDLVREASGVRRPPMPVSPASTSARSRPRPRRPVARRAFAAAEHSPDEASLPDALVGLGPGLTPSGDDVLVGMLAGLDWGRDALPDARRRRRLLAGRLRMDDFGLERRTSRLSAQLLRAAVAGCYPEPVLRLLRPLASFETGGPAGGASGRDGEVSAAVDGLLAMGHDSGRAMLLGIASALVPGDWRAWALLERGVERETGLEPATCSLEGCRSAN